MKLKISQAGKILVVLMLLLVPFIFAAGCGGEELRLPKTILVYKLDSAGDTSWITKFENGMLLSAQGILETSDGGYLVYGSEANLPPNKPGHQSYPLLIQLDSQGTILWSRTLNQTINGPTVYGLAASSAIETPEGNIIISTDRASNDLLQTDSKGTIEWIRPVPISIKSSIVTHDGGALFVGNGVIKTDGNGTILWEKPIESARNVLQTSDGHYILDHVVTDWNRSRSMTAISYLANETTLWTNEIGQTYTNDTTSLWETPDGLIEVTLASERQLTFNRDGNVVAEKNITANSPMTRTSDGGYVYFDCSTRNTPGTISLEPICHVIREGYDGKPVWDHSLNSTAGYPGSILQTRDGGFVVIS